MPDGGSNISRESLYEFVERHEKIDESISEAQYTVRALKKDRKQLRALISAAGHTLSVFDDTMAKMAMSHEEREAQDRELRRNLAWLGMPLGAQAEMFSEAETAVPPEIQVSRVRHAGHAAGKLGRERAANPWEAGSLLYQEWDAHWLIGRNEAADSTVEAEKPRRGRPPKADGKKAASKGKGKGKGKGSRTAPPADPVFAQEPQDEPEDIAPPTSPEELDRALEFDTETEGSA